MTKGNPLPEDWRTIPENICRNYEVAVVIPRFRLAPGNTIWYRSYLVVNRRDRAIELAKSLVDEVDYGLLTFDDPKYDDYRSATGYSMARNNSHWKRLLGYAYINKPENGSFAPLSSVLGASHFPAANAHHRDVWVDVAGNVGP